MTHPEEVTRLAAPDCRHSVIRTYSAADPAIPPLWACESCNRRFYPACPECVSVGHRGECAAGVRVQPEPQAGDLAREALLAVVKPNEERRKRGNPTCWACLMKPHRPACPVDLAERALRPITEAATPEASRDE